MTLLKQSLISIKSPNYGKIHFSANIVKKGRSGSFDDGIKVSREMKENDSPLKAQDDLKMKHSNADLKEIDAFGDFSI